MDTLTLIVIIAGVGVVSLILFFMVRPSGAKRTTDSLYGEGLRLMLEGEYDRAAEKLKAVVKQDTGYVDAYLKLGDIYRKMGHLKQALKIHKSLTVRRTTYPAQQIDIHHSLMDDYKALGQYEKALHHVNQMLEINKKSAKALAAKLEIFHILKRWEDAAAVLELLQKYTGVNRAKELALYKVREGLRLEREGENKNGRIQYRKALKSDPNCCAAMYYLGCSYANEERIEEAVENWQQFGEHCPDLLHLVSGKIEQQLFELGNFGEIERFYNQLLNKQPENIEAAAGLASFYEKKGQVESAIASLEEAVEKEPGSLRARLLLAKNYNKKQKNTAVEEQLNIMLKELTRQEADHEKALFKTANTKSTD